MIWLAVVVCVMSLCFGACYGYVIILLSQILNQQQLQLEKEQQLMAKLSEVQDAIAQFKAAISAAITKELTEIMAQIQALKDASGGAASASDLDNIINSLSASKIALTSQIDAISDTDGSAPAPTPTPTPTPEQP